MQPIEPTAVPAELAARLARVTSDLAELGVDWPGDVAATVVRVCVASDFVLDVLKRDPDMLVERLADRAPLSYETLAARFRPTAPADGEAAALASLRKLRRVETARIAWRDLAGWADLETCLLELSQLADFAIEAATRYATAAIAPRFAAPRDRRGETLPLIVLAMGKLGGRELNFSSDVDLVFVHPDVDVDGNQDLYDEHLASAQAYFARLAQLVINLLDRKTADGFAFRVDTRLRPFGASGPLVVSIGALESYLIQHGRGWERYAYVKARLVTGAAYEQELAGSVLTPFVYRRYLDYGVFDSLREMKRLIAREVARRDLAENIKLGPGGIREIEFIVQAFQLVRGGRNPRLRERSLLTALPRLVGERLLPEATVRRLIDAYRFLRVLENRLQAIRDAQTHDLPDDPETRARLAFAMGESGWESLSTRIETERHAVESLFERIAWEAVGGVEHDAPRGPSAAWEAGAVADVLAGTALAGNAAVETLLAELRRSNLYQRMDDTSRQRLAAVVVRTVELAGSLAEPAKAIERVLPVYRAIGRRSAYLALLNENPAALERLLSIAAQSAWLARQTADYPLLLDELLDTRLFEQPPTRAELEQLLAQTLEHVDRADLERVLDAIRVFQRTATFRVAVADRLGALPVMKVSDRLTDIAELVLGFALDTASRELTAKHGRPMRGDPPEVGEAGFAVIGYGKLGGLELGYSSDLDMVFLHDSAGAVHETDREPAVDNEQYFARLAQRLIYFLTIQTSTGKLYEVDTRLRPSGRAGHIVSTLTAFEHYQRNEAWVWEHQALLRSRALAGSASVRAGFERIRRDTLVAHVDRARLKDEVATMRARMRAELSRGGSGTFDLKQGPGGIADIEFLVDYWVLAHADRHPELVEFPDNVRQLEALARTGVVPAERCERLKDAYLALRARTHELALDEAERIVAAGELADLRDWVVERWTETFG